MDSKSKNSTKCDVCGKIIKHKKNLKKHMSTVHNESEKTLSCPICDRQFHFNFNLKRHLKTHEKDIYECCECFMKFKSEHSLKVHLKKEYTEKSVTPSPKKCPLCEFSGSKNIILEHFTTKHDILIEREILYFSSMDDFMSWKASVESTTTSHFVLQCREIVKADGTVLRKYECHRSGLFKPKGKQKRNSKRLLGSNKINAYCPAEIIMTNKSGLIEVSFTKNHIGHTLDLCRINLSKAERDEIARKIALQIPFDRILSEVRSDISSEKLSRIHLLNKKDLFNIQKAYNIKREVKKEKKDKKRKRKNAEDSKNTITRLSSNDLILNENYEFADVVFETIDIETAQNDLSVQDTPILHENLQTWNSESEALIEGKKQAIEETYGLICLIDKIKNMEELNNFLNLIKPIKTILESNTSNL